MSEDPCTNRKEDSDQDAKTTQDQISSEEIEIEEGYETPTSEEHKIPAVPWSCPPPAPKKRKRLASERRINIRKVEVFHVAEEELDSFFSFFLPKSKAAPPPEQPSPPVSEPEPDQGTSPKKIRSD